MYVRRVSTETVAGVLWKRESDTGVSCEYYEISKNTFSYRTPPVAAFVSN